jgi:hypothetical protein
MPSVLLFVVQSFEDQKGKLMGNDPFEFRTRETALAWARHLAETKMGVIAWSKSGDPDTGVWDGEPEILFKAGQLPKETGDED